MLGPVGAAVACLAAWPVSVRAEDLVFRGLGANLELQTEDSEFDRGDSHSEPAQSGTEVLSDHWAGGKLGEGRDSVSEIVSEALGGAEEGWWGF